MHLTGIGDVVHGLPIANDLKRRDPGCNVTWIAEPAPAQVLAEHPAIDRVVTFRKGRGLAGVAELRRDLEGARFDVTLNMQRYFKSIPPTVLSGAPVRIGLPRSMTRDGVSLFNTHHLPDRGWRHTQDVLLAFREPLDLPLDAPVEWRLDFSAAERDEQRRFFEAFAGDGPAVALVLATANPRKDWPAERWADLADALAARGARLLLVGGPAARERAAAELVVARSSAPVRNELGDSVRRMMWLVDGVDLLVSPDTGPLHVAHALGTPVVGLYGHTNPARVGPWRRYRDLVVDRYTEPGRTPDPSGYTPKEGRMERIRVDDVLEKVDLALTASDRA